MLSYYGEQPQWTINWNFDRSNQTYHIGDKINLTLTFNNTGQIPIHLRRIGVWFDWMPMDRWYVSDCNAVYQPGQGRIFNQIQNVQAEVSLDTEPRHHNYKIGVDYRYWNFNQWAERYGVEWAQPSGPALDQVLITYPPTRNFRVFVSHSEKDRELTDRIADYIRRCGQHPYIAESLENPDLGKKIWEEKINGAIQISNVVLVLWTQNSLMSQAVQYEIARAKTIGKRIIPAIESSLNPPDILRELVYTKFDYNDHVQATKAIIRSLLNYEAQAQPQQNQNSILGFLALLVLLGAVSGGKR